MVSIMKTSITYINQIKNQKSNKKLLKIPVPLFNMEIFLIILESFLAMIIYQDIIYKMT